MFTSIILVPDISQFHNQLLQYSNFNSPYYTTWHIISIDYQEIKLLNVYYKYFIIVTGIAKWNEHQENTHASLRPEMLISWNS